MLRHEPAPDRAPHRIADGVRRLVAPNAGPGTYHGTNTYLVDEADGTTVIDPGPHDQGHVSAILAACPGGIARILVTHSHPDHRSAAPLVQQASGAPIWGYLPSATPEFAPDIGLHDGERLGSFVAVHTPGHCSDHLCYGWGPDLLFSGDMVMGWSSTVVSPPDGRMAHYMASLEKLQGRAETLYLPGHGPAVADPHGQVSTFLARRRQREADIKQAVGAGSTIAQIVSALYSHTEARLLPAAGRTVHAHLIKLESEGHLRRTGELWTPTGDGREGP